MDFAVQHFRIRKGWSIMKKWILPLGMVAVALIISVAVYGRMPDQVPVHWNVRGEVDGYAPKALALFLLPAVMLIVWLFIRIAPVIDPKRATLKKNVGEIDTINFFMMLILLGIHVATIIYGMGYEFDMSIIAELIAGVLFVVIGNFLPRFRHNYFFGIRTPWTLADEEVWRKSNQIGGKMFFFGGLIVILSVFLPRQWMTFILFATLFVCAGVPAVLSYVLYQKKQSDS